MPAIAFLECSHCHSHVSPAAHPAACPACNSLLYVRYDMDALRQSAARPDVDAGRRASSFGIWHYSSVLPEVDPVTLGEGRTPMLTSRHNPNLFLKQDANNPTGTKDARGFSLAISMAQHYGIRKLALPSTGDSAAALAAYAAAAGLEALIFLPRHVPFPIYLECVAYGAEVTLVDGFFSDCERIVAERSQQEGWLDLSSLKEPFRVEGEKTIGYEMVEQFGWKYPDAILYPVGTTTAGDYSLLGVWKAFSEMEALGWIHAGSRPRIFAVRGSEPATPSARQVALVAQFPAGPDTLASRLRETGLHGDAMILDILHESGGRALDPPHDDAICASLRNWASREGILLSPQGAAAAAAFDELINAGLIQPSDRVVIFNPCAGMKYAEVIADAMQVERPPASNALAPSSLVERDHRGIHLPAKSRVGGIITPQ